MQKALAKSRSALEAAYREALENQHGGYRDSVEIAFANLGEIFETCVPRGQELAKLRHDPQAIAARIRQAAIARGMDIFKEDEPGRLLNSLLVLAYISLDKDPDFMAALERVNWKEAFERLQDIQQKLDELPAAVASKVVKGVADLLKALDDKLKATAEAEGVRHREIVALARRIAEDVQDPDQAMRELKRAVDVAIEVQREGRQRANSGEFVAAVLHRVAALSGAGRHDEAAHEADEAFATWQAEERDRQQRATQQGVTLLRAGLNQDLLRRNAVSAAQRLAKISELETPDHSERFASLLKVCGDWLERGRDKGLNLDLEVAIELGRVAQTLAKDVKQRGAVLTLSGTALNTLGERESGTARLEEAVAAFRAAFGGADARAGPLAWATTQNNLGAALWALGERESGTARLEEAVAAFRAAAKELTPEAAPYWRDIVQNNLAECQALLDQRQKKIGVEL